MRFLSSSFQYRDKLSPQDQLEHRRKFYGAYTKLWLSAGDDIIKKMNEVIGLSGSPPAQQDKPTHTMASLILSMRKELGIKTRLTEEDVRFVAI